MADYIQLKESGDKGIIAINKNVFQAIAEITMKEVENVMPAEGTFVKPVTVSVEDGKLNFDCNITVRYGANVSTTCGKVQTRIYENILFMTGVKPGSISVNVIGFDIAGKN